MPDRSFAAHVLPHVKPGKEGRVYRKIMVPVDLVHAERLDKALRTAADLAKHYGAELCYVGVTPNAPSEIAHTPAEFAQKLEAFGKERGAADGVEATTRAYSCHDPVIDLDNTLLEAVDDIGADLVVMASHIPDVVDYIWPSNGGKVAGHSDASVFVVR
jgi:nucleotide-binding universal stress UspA family protein